MTRRNIDFLGLVGVVLLIGVVVNNGIVLIDYVNRLRAEGHRGTRRWFSPPSGASARS